MADDPSNGIAWKVQLGTGKIMGLGMAILCKILSIAIPYFLMGMSSQERRDGDELGARVHFQVLRRYGRKAALHIQRQSQISQVVWDLTEKTSDSASFSKLKANHFP